MSCRLWQYLIKSVVRIWSSPNWMIAIPGPKSKIIAILLVDLEFLRIGRDCRLAANVELRHWARRSTISGIGGRVRWICIRAQQVRDALGVIGIEVFSLSQAFDDVLDVLWRVAQLLGSNFCKSDKVRTHHILRPSWIRYHRVSARRDLDHTGQGRSALVDPSHFLSWWSLCL